MKNCLKCNQEFESKHKHQKYCNIRCANRAAKKREYLVRKKFGLCHVCGVRERYNGYVRCQECQNKHNADSIKRNRRNKIKMIQMYGGACLCCGEKEITFLTLEHINKNGKKHREERGSTGTILDAINIYDPLQYTILCMNCNWATRYGDTCPHKLQGGVF